MSAFLNKSFTPFFWGINSYNTYCIYLLKEAYMKKIIKNDNNPMSKNGLGGNLSSKNDVKGITTDLKTAAGAPVASNQDSMTAGQRGPMLLQDVWFMEKMAHFDREVIPERRMHAKGSGAFGTFTVTHDITQYTKAKIFSEVGKKTEMFARFSTVEIGRASCRERV